MQVVFNKLRKIPNEIKISLLAGLTGYSKDTVRLALESAEAKEELLRSQLEETVEEVLEKRKEKGQNSSAERRG
ncbi:MAG: hypothetical protein QY322_02570 [bacterium]|nr:MAG: hypothetical protein QY322_02570 [bacterium]